MAEDSPGFGVRSPATDPPPRPVGAAAVLQRVVHLVQGVENAIGALFCVTVSLLLPVVCLLGVVEPGHGSGRDSALSLLGERGIAIVALIVSVSLESYGIYLVFGSLRQRWGGPVVPLGPAAAMAHGRFPLLLRPLIAAWWLAHFLLAAGLGYSAELAGQVSGRGHASQSKLVPELLISAFAFGLVYAANTYLALAAGSIWRSERVVNAIWRRRILIDLLVVAAGMVAATLIPE